METIFRFIITTVLSLFIFGTLSMLVPIIFASLSKIFQNNKSIGNDKESSLYSIILFLFCGFIMSIFFHSFDYFYTTVALIAPMIFIGKGMLNEKGIKSWMPFIFYIIGWFSFYLIFQFTA